MKLKIKWLVLGLMYLSLLVTAAAGLVFRQAIADWWVLKDYQPSLTIQTLASQVGFTDYGRRLFYVNQPQLISGYDFADSCDDTDARLVLGCFTGDNIYILDVVEPRLEAVLPVTAAHEMLHEAYTRLSDRDKSELGVMLRSAYQEADSQHLRDILNQYQGLDYDSLTNELHSIIGTEVEELGQELEQHYAQYFSDRKIVTEFARNYNLVFDQINQEIDLLDNQLNTLEPKIEALKNSLIQESDRLQSLQKELLAQLDSGGSAGEYNSLVQSYNQAVDAYNLGVDRLQSMIDDYNLLVADRNALSAEQEHLVQELNNPLGTIDE